VRWTERNNGTNHRDGQLRVSSSVKVASLHQATAVVRVRRMQSTPHFRGPFGAGCALNRFIGRVPCSAILPGEARCTQQRSRYRSTYRTRLLLYHHLRSIGPA
jgi:hypothetical protein